MFKNVAGQYIFIYAHNTINDSPETGLAGTGLVINITKDNGVLAESNATATGDATEVSATEAKGVYRIASTQAETNANAIAITGKSDVAGVEISPQVIQTQTVMVGTDGAITSLAAITDDKDSYKATSVTVSDKTGFKLASDGADGLSAGSGDLKSVKDKTDNLPASPAAVGSEMALSSAAQTAIVAAVFAKTGITAGGTWTFAKLVKVSLAWATGNWRDKEGEAGTYEILDPDDGSTVIMELIPSATTPQKRVTIL